MAWYDGDQHTTNYGAGGAANAGGFMAGDVTSSPAGGKGGYGKDTLTPVTIKQVVDATQKHPDAGHVISGLEVNQVTFVGQVRNISTQTTNHTYKLDDGTGTIEVKQWIDTDAANDDAMDSGEGTGPSKITEGAYCRVYGRIKAFNNKKHVGAHVIRPVTDYNEINFHLLEATYVHLFFTRGAPDPTIKPESGKDDNFTAATGARSGMGINGRPLPNLTTIANKVYHFLLTTPRGGEGLHMQQIAAGLQESIAEIHKAGEELQANSLIYSTIDDHTWDLLEVN